MADVTALAPDLTCLPQAAAALDRFLVSFWIGLSFRSFLFYEQIFPHVSNKTTILAIKFERTLILQQMRRERFVREK